MPASIRLAQPSDSDQITAIYAPFCQHTIVSFELAAPTPEEMAGRIAKVTARYPWLVLEDDGRIAGYAYASLFRERAAYQWSVEVSAYVHINFRRKNVGKALYTALLALLCQQGFYKAFAGIALPNPASVGFHTALGFEPIGVYRGVGYKLGGWHDVGWYQFALQPEQIDPIPPRPVTEIVNTTAWHQGLSAGLTYYHSHL